ncbi:hypothetical protein F4703DRAFT_1899965 [Phycomyces blakesleeanus]
MLIAGAWYPFFFLFFFSVRPFSATMSATLTQHFDGYIDSDFFRCPLCPPTEHTLFFSARAFSLHGSHKHKRKFVIDLFVSHLSWARHPISALLTTFPLSARPRPSSVPVALASTLRPTLCNDTIFSSTNDICGSFGLVRVVVGLPLLKSWM